MLSLNTHMLVVQATRYLPVAEGGAAEDGPLPRPGTLGSAGRLRTHVQGVVDRLGQQASREVVADVADWNKHKNRDGD